MRADFELAGSYPDTTLVDIAECCVLAANDKKASSLPSINDNEGRETIGAMFKVAIAE